MTDTVQVPREATVAMLQAVLTMNRSTVAPLRPLPIGYEIGWAARIWEVMLAAAPQATDPRDAEIERLKEKVVDLAGALSLAHEVTGNLLQLLGKEQSARDTAESRIATLTAERDEAREALRKYAVRMEYDYPTEVPVPCGLWCDECKQHVEDDGIGHASGCMCAALTTQPSKTETRDDE